MSLFKDKVLLITGGTGSFGNAVLNRFLKTDIGEIRIFSRDEKKQDDMRHDFQARMPEVANKIKFYIGDVRNKSTLKYAMKGVDYVFHAAALKQVPSCEFFLQGYSLDLITYVTDRLGHDARYAIDSTKLQKELGWEPSLQFEEGIEKTVRWYLENEEWLENVTSGDYQLYYEKMYSNR